MSMGHPAALHSVLSAAGPQARAIEDLWWVMLWVTAAVAIVVFAMLGAALVRGRRKADPPTSDTRLNVIVSGAVTLTVAILFGFLVLSVRTGHAVAAPGGEGAVPIALTGHQWWWEVTYEDAVPSQRVTLANEIHIPIGRPIAVKVTSRDVIHSFWVPNLIGKRDLIPGYTTAIWLQADRAGVFRGQCAEFCGRQHAHMAFHVVAEPEGAFRQWLDAERQTAAPPGTAEARRGHSIFMAAHCSGCHTIRGTEAAGQVAPDLTHVGRRLAIGGGILPNTTEHLKTWIADPHAPKPGNQMPSNPFGEADLAALAAYLGSLR